MSIWEYAGDGKAEEVEKLYKKNKSVVNKKDPDYYNWTPLHYAARYDQDEIAKKLIKWGATIDAKDKNRETPLHVAAKNRSKKICVVLVEAGANTNARNSNFQDPKTVAAENHNVDIKEYLEDPKKNKMKYIKNIYNTEDSTGADGKYSIGY